MALFAAWRAGAVAVPLNARLREYELRRVLPDARPTAIVTIGAHAAYRFADVIASLLPELPTVRGCFVIDATGEIAERRDNVAAGERPAELAPEIAAVLYTSGSTGAPKGALVTHACAVAGARSLADVLELSPEDTAALVVPASHAFGLGCLLAAVASGSAAALVESSFSFDPLLQAMEAQGTTVVHGAPALFGRLLVAAPGSLEPVRTGLVAGAPCPPAVLEQLDATDTTILNVFGMTEIGAATSCRHDDPAERRHTTVGRALEGYEFRVAGEDEPGELQVRGPYVMPGYLDQPEQTAQAFDGDWFRTGDLGTIDDQGYIRIAGRAKEVVHVGGFNVFPAEVEGFLLGHPGVAQAVVVGIPHERMGEALAAFVVPRPGHELEPGRAAALRTSADRRLQAALHDQGGRRAALPALGQAGPGGAGRRGGGRDRGSGPMRNVTSFEGVAVPVAALEGIPLLEGLQPDELVAVAASMRFRELPANSLLVGEGLPGQSMFVMVGGLANELASIARTPEARSRSVFAEGRLVGKLRRGDVVGAMALVSGEPHATTVKTVVPSAALELNADEFRELIARFPALLANLNRILSGRLAESTRRQAERGRRGEAVALLAAPSSSAAVPDILTAARAASPGSVEAIDTGSSLEEALARLDDALLEHRTVVLVAELDPSGIGVLLEQVDRAVVLAGEAETQGLPTAATAAAPLEVVLVAEAGATPRRREDVVRVFESAGGALAADDTAWLGRHLAKTKLGLALGAGGAKGYAHVGVLEVLERAGYAVDYVGGSSIGAIVGAYVALGMTAAEIDATLRAAFTPEAIAEVFKLSLSGESTGRETMTRILRETTRDRSFEDTEIPFVAMAVDLNAAPARSPPRRADLAGAARLDLACGHVPAARA